MDIIKTKRLKGYDITLIYFEEIKGYEVQISKKPYEEITDTDGIYTYKKDGLKVWSAVIKEIKEGKYECSKINENTWVEKDENGNYNIYQHHELFKKTDFIFLRKEELKKLKEYL